MNIASNSTSQETSSTTDNQIFGSHSSSVDEVVSSSSPDDLDKALADMEALGDASANYTEDEGIGADGASSADQTTSTEDQASSANRDFLKNLSAEFQKASKAINQGIKNGSAEIKPHIDQALKAIETLFQPKDEYQDKARGNDPEHKQKQLERDQLLSSFINVTKQWRAQIVQKKVWTNLQSGQTSKDFVKEQVGKLLETSQRFAENASKSVKEELSEMHSMYNRLVQSAHNQASQKNANKASKEQAPHEVLQQEALSEEELAMQREAAPKDASVDGDFVPPNASKINKMRTAADLDRNAKAKSAVERSETEEAQTKTAKEENSEVAQAQQEIKRTPTKKISLAKVCELILQNKKDLTEDQRVKFSDMQEKYSIEEAQKQEAMMEAGAAAMMDSDDQSVFSRICSVYANDEEKSSSSENESAEAFKPGYAVAINKAVNNMFAGYSLKNLSLTQTSFEIGSDQTYRGEVTDGIKEFHQLQVSQNQVFEPTVGSYVPTRQAERQQLIAENKFKAGDLKTLGVAMGEVPVNS